MKKLEDKVALVTGGSRGIGAAIVYALAEEGADVGVNYVANKEKAEQVCENVRKKNGVKAIAIKADVTMPVEVQEMIDTVLKEFGKIDILVNNAGIVPIRKLLDTTLEEWNRTLAIDLTSVFLCTKAVLPSMLSRREGRIINISSVVAQTGRSELSAYVAAKGGVIAFTKTVAREVARDGILVNCVAPGPTLTDVVFTQRTKEWKKERENSLLLGRLGLPEDIAHSVVFLASSDSDIFTGQTLCPNSGDFMP